MFTKDSFNSAGAAALAVYVFGDVYKRQQFEYAKQAVKDRGLSVEVEYITDMQKVMEYGVMSMPALVVNEKVVRCV